MEDLKKRAHKRENEALRARSGSVDVHGRLVAFLYTLMRDEVPPGTVERIVRDSRDPDCQYTNGWLAKYAEDLANRLQDPGEDE